jgi:hypothetical protein
VSVNDQKLEGIIIILFLANWQCQLWRKVSDTWRITAGSATRTAINHRKTTVSHASVWVPTSRNRKNFEKKSKSST